ncbi:exodeoxyribonuclease VII large subunit [Sphaerotilus sp.]|uniref:exodeoxyribonuclease VII large subunit n=1 Tax=Sphaerotilus sp. TaxID=2093942 RepID=UPI0034E23FA8
MNTPNGARVWDVALLVQAIGDTLQTRFGAIAVRGELAGFTRASSGHCYFNLRAPDGSAGLRCAMFRRAAGYLDFSPRDGQAVELRGKLAVYEPRGELQMIVEAMRPAGEGALMEQFLRLKARLEAEGLFDAERKRPLPGFPRRIGVVTSLAAAALHDVVTALRRRAPHVEVVVYPAPVQGAEAPPLLVRAIAEAGRRNEVDVLIVCRGGGSLEDLWAFNDEAVARAIAASPVPVVCGVGHETDFTLADFAADLRAPTPTAAAELVAPARAACLETLAQRQRQLQQALQRRLDREAQRLDRASLRLSRPTDVLRQHQQRLALLAQRHAAALPQSLQRRGQRLDVLAARLQALDPARVLQRGYAWVTDAEGRTLVSVGQVQPGAALMAVLHDGRVRTTVTAVEPDPPRQSAD